MAGPYDIYPAVDANYDFPPEVKTRLAISPAFTGTPVAPTPTANDNSTKVATTGYIDTIAVARSRTGITSANSLDSIVTPGMYLATGIGPTNASSTNGLLIVEASGTAVVQRYYEDGGNRAEWFRESYTTGSSWNPWNRLTGLAQQAVTAAYRDALVNMATGAMVLVDDGILYRYNGTAWRPWESAWIAYAATASGPNGGVNATPGYNVSNCKYKYMTGQVRYAGTMVLQGASATITSQWVLSTPVVPSGYRGPGKMIAKNSSDGNRTWEMYYDIDSSGFYPKSIGFNSGGWVGKYDYNLNAPFSEAWAQNDTLEWDILYDPATN